MPAARTVLLIAASCAAATAARPSFEEWRVTHKVQYATEVEAATRASIFAANMDLIDSLNALPGRTVTLGATRFADWTAAEWRARFTAAVRPSSPVARVSTRIDAIPTNVDWTQSGCINSVMNHGQCGSVWAIAAVEELSAVCCLTSAHPTAATNLTVLSAQEVLDCDTVAQGCNGGFPTDAWHYAMNAGGLCSAAAYPYHGAPGTCRNASCHHLCAPKSIVAVLPNSEAATLAALAEQPIVLSVDASTNDFMFYVGGVISSATCGSNINHMLLATGYNTDATTPYIRALNSWGAAWGETGYVRIGTSTAAAGPAGVCGVYSAPYYVTV